MDHLGRKRMDQTQPTIDNIIAVAKRWRAERAPVLCRGFVPGIDSILRQPAWLCVQIWGFTTDLTRRAAELDSARGEVHYETRFIMAQR